MIQPIILAAGKGTRFVNFDGPKVLALFRGKPLLAYLLDSFGKTPFAKPIVVVGYYAEQVQALVRERGKCVLQVNQLGTAHAVQDALGSVGEEAKTIVVIYGDTPFWKPETFIKLQRMHAESFATVTVTTVRFEDPSGYGRIVRDKSRRVEAIVEHVDATPEQLQIKECNSGLYAFDYAWLKENISLVKPSKKGEYYLTDIVGIAIADGKKVETVSADWREALGVNTPEQLKFAEQTIPQDWFA